MNFKIYYLKNKDKDDKNYKYLKLKPNYGIKGYRFGITSLITDIFLKQRETKYRLNYYHDGDVMPYLIMLPKWVETYYNACENKWFICNTSMAFSPVKEKDLDIKEIKNVRKESYSSTKKFLEEFFNV